MDPHKTNKLTVAIQRTLSELLQTAVKDPRIGMVTINGVKLNRDHSVAKVYFSVIGDDGQGERSREGLVKARGFLQQKLGQALKLRQVPELRFVPDHSLARGFELTEVLGELAAQGELAGEDARRRRLTLQDFSPPAELLAALCQGESIWLVPHWNPDPDAMGSALALGAALAAADKQVRVFSYPEPAIGLRDLPGYDRATLPAEAEAAMARDEPDTLVLVDCHRRERTGPLADLLHRIGNVWCIDHHLISGRRVPVPGWNDPRACSTSTLVYRVISELATGAGGRFPPVTFTLEMATCLYAGLLNDTGGFRFANTLPLSFELARRLAELGVDTTMVSRWTLHRYRPAGIALLQKVLGTMEYAAGGRVLTMQVDQEMFAQTDSSPADTEGFVNLATAVDGVEYVLFLKEIEPLLWRVSLRAPGGGDVQRVAARYGGGGHRQAAGCDLFGPADEVAAQLAAELEAALP
jgi:phosphoesterase RecJ-like protein